MRTPSVGELELAALLAVVRLGRNAYGANIRRNLSVLAKRDYSVGGIYTTLQRIEDKGLIASFLTEPIAVRGGRSRRRYEITASGRAVVETQRALRNASWRGIPVKLRPA